VKGRTESVRRLDREIFRLALPALATLISEPLLLLADSAIVGHLGTDQLAGLAIAANLLGILTGLCIFLAYGTTDFALRESMDQIKNEHGADVDYMRIRAYPFAHEIHDFVASHERIYVVEQDRDAQLESLLKLDLPADQVVKLRSILHYNGLPMDARTITEEFVTKEGL